MQFSRHRLVGGDQLSSPEYKTCFTRDLLESFSPAVPGWQYVSQLGAPADYAPAYHA
jgi:hypothetical protein